MLRKLIWPNMFHRSTVDHPQQWHIQTTGHTPPRAISKTVSQPQLSKYLLLLSHQGVSKQQRGLRLKHPG